MSGRRDADRADVKLSPEIENQNTIHTETPSNRTTLFSVLSGILRKFPPQYNSFTIYLWYFFVLPLISQLSRKQSLIDTVKNYPPRSKFTKNSLGHLKKLSDFFTYFSQILWHEISRKIGYYFFISPKTELIMNF